MDSEMYILTLLDFSVSFSIIDDQILLTRLLHSFDISGFIWWSFYPSVIHIRDVSVPSLSGKTVSVPSLSGKT